MIHQQISHGACEAAKRAAVNEYRIRQKKKSGSDLSGFSAKAAFLAAVNRKFLDHSALIGGSAGAAAACRLTLTSKGNISYLCVIIFAKQCRFYQHIQYPMSKV